MEKKSKEDDFMDKVKKWFFDEDGDGEDVVEEYDAVEVDTEPKTSLFEQAKFSKTSEAVKSLNMNKDSHLVLFEPRSFGETQDIASYCCKFTSFTKRSSKTCGRFLKRCYLCN